jgi:hypothetical protein
MKTIIKALIFFAIIFLCFQFNKNDSLNDITENQAIFGYWQLDYYPDSIIHNQSISDNSKWGSSYAYNLKLTKDSCAFYGWHEGWRSKMIKISNNEYRIDTIPQYWEVKIISKDKLIMREIFGDTGKFYPYHKVNKLLTQDSLKRLLAHELFSSKYQVLFNDTFLCEKIIDFTDNCSVHGIKNVFKYNFITDLNSDFPADNAFGFGDFSYYIMNFTYNFYGDTLFIKNYDILSDGFDFSGIKASKTRMKLLKLDKNK